MVSEKSDLNFPTWSQGRIALSPDNVTPGSLTVYRHVFRWQKQLRAFQLPTAAGKHGEAADEADISLGIVKREPRGSVNIRLLVALRNMNMILKQTLLLSISCCHTGVFSMTSMCF